MDYATKYPAAVPLKNIVADALFSIFADLGFSEELLLDNRCPGDLSIGVKRIRTLPYHPGCLRFHATLKSMLDKLITYFKGQWNLALPAALFAYRETPHSMTGYSPFQLHYGSRPLDLKKEA